jgi:hypothetical protein
VPKEKWIQKAFPEKTRGALHRQLGIPQSKTIPKKTLRDIKSTEIGKHSHGHTVTPLLKKRVNAAINAQKRRR